MNSAIPQVLASDSDVKEKLAQQSLPVLLNFTASWCEPCKAFAPVLGNFRGRHGDRVEVLRVDLDACRDLARQYGVRAVPTTILLQDGVERDRFVGAKSERAMVQWLVAREIALTAAEAPDDDKRLAFGAFYGDESLKAFLVDRLRRHMDQGEVMVARFPSWVDGKGSVSGALVHNGSPDVFEGITGMPCAFALALEFLWLEHWADAQTIFDAVAPGQDVRAAPLRLLRAWLTDDALGWTAALDSVPADALRRDWLAASASLLEGADVPAARWAELRDRARALASLDSDPYRQLDDDLMEIIALMSPPADVRDGSAWGRTMERIAYATMRLAEYAAGWTKEDTAKPLLRHRFFQKHIPVDAGGRFDQQLFEAKRAEWERENADFVARENSSGDARHATYRELHERFRPVLAAILRGD